MFNMDEYKKTLADRSDALFEYYNNDILMYAYRCDSEAAAARQLTLEWDETHESPEAHLENNHKDYIAARDGVETQLYRLSYKFGVFLFMHGYSLDVLLPIPIEVLKKDATYDQNYKELLLCEKAIYLDPQIDFKVFEGLKEIRQNDNKALAMALSRLGFYNAQNGVKEINNISYIYNDLLKIS